MATASCAPSTTKTITTNYRKAITAAAAAAAAAASKATSTPTRSPPLTTVSNHSATHLSVSKDGPIEAIDRLHDSRLAQILIDLNLSGPITIGEVEGIPLDVLGVLRVYHPYRFAVLD